MNRISAVIIALNEAHRISRTIESLRDVADEIIVVDSMSTDNTVEIAESMGCRVERRQFAGFGAQRQYATSLTSNRYVLFIDADEVLSPMLRNTLIDLKKSDFAHSVYALSRLNFFCDSPIRHCGWYPDRQVRLFDKRYATWNFHDINERVIFPDTLHPFPLEGDILHYRCSSAEEYREKLASHALISAKVIAAKGKSPSAIAAWFDAMKAYFHTYLSLGGIFEGKPGHRISLEHYRARRLTYKLARKLLREQPAGSLSHSN